MVKLLYDAVLPQSLAVEVGSNLQLHRWDGGDAVDTELVRVAAEKGYRAVILVDRSSLDQPGLLQAAKNVGLALVAVEASNPIQAKERIIRNAKSLRRSLADSDCILVLANRVCKLEESD